MSNDERDILTKIGLEKNAIENTLKNKKVIAKIISILQFIPLNKCTKAKENLNYALATLILKQNTSTFNAYS